MTGFHPFGGRLSRRRKDSEQDPYVKYGDITLTRLDVDVIINKGWLEDNAIAFWQEYLEHDKLRYYPNSKVCLVRPAIAHLLSVPYDSSLKGSLPDFSKHTHILLPVNNDSSQTYTDGINEGHGQHWSLLVVSTVDGVAFHYDSNDGMNDVPAHRMTQNLEAALGQKLRFVHMKDTPQQKNADDCGVIVCVLMHHLVFKRLLRKGSDEKVNMSMRDRDVNCDQARKEMAEIIEERRKIQKSQALASNSTRARASSPPGKRKEQDGQ